ncbi:hypothetical protein ACFPOB_20490 [Bosea eneae]|uniref:Tip attachment protein J HDII-ins2 domain-containing protein n=1 Tax=Bosea eneae TaxID=151454 RepID=A0ABW0IUW7_9HYPH
MLHDVNLITLSKFDPRHQVRGVAPLGASVAEIVAMTMPRATPDMVRTIIGDQEVLPKHRARVRPKPGTTVIIRAIPRGDRDVLRSVLLIAVTVAAVAVGQIWLGPALATSLGFAAGTAGANFIAGVTSSVFALGGTMLVNALIPPRPGLSDDAPSPTYSVQGWKNVANPNGVIPSVLGYHRMAPPFAALPYTEIVGDDQYIRAKFLFGYGPVKIRNLRIGETPITDFKDVTVQVREGYPDDEPLTLYTDQVIEDALSAALTVKAGATRRVTASDVTGVSIDITFPGGLVSIRTKDKKSRQMPFDVAFSLRQKPFGSPTWQDLPPVVIRGQQAGKTLRRTIRWDFPTRGRWEIELTRLTTDWDDIDQTDLPAQIVSRSMWTAIRSYRPEYPIDFDKPLALADVMIRASEQLNGSLDDFNADVSTICRDWDYASSSWIVRETQNPASLYRHVLQGPAMTYPLEDSEVAALEAWHEFCRARGLTYNRVHDYEASVLDVLSDIAAAGRASPHDTGTSWGVVIDRALTMIEGHISPRNSWGFAGERTYAERPDAFRVRFMDETNSYQNAERLVPWPGFVGDPVVTEDLAMPGITNPDLVWKEARRRQYELDHRPDTYTINQDFEHIVHTRGSLVRLSHDVLDRTQKSGRVRTVDAGVGVVTLDEIVTMEAGELYACRFRRETGESLLRTVATVAGETHALTLTGSGDLPAPGDLAFFGIATRESAEVIVKGIEVSDNLTGRITMVDHAPEIEALTDAEVPPPWDGRAGGPVVVVSGGPPVPVITEIRSSQEIGDDEDSIMVMLAPGAGPISTASYEVRHRVVGAPSWNSTPAALAAASALLTGYVSGEVVEMQPQALGYGGVPSDWGELKTHEIGINDTIVPPIASFVAARDGGLWRFDWTVGSVPSGREAAAIEGVRLAGKLGVWDDWADLDALHAGTLASSPWLAVDPNTSEIHTFGCAAFTESGRRGAATLVLGGTWRNLLEHSDDPDAWDATRVGLTSGALVSDPLGGTRARAMTFAADAGYIYAAGAIGGDLTGRTFTLSVYLRAPAGKAKIMLIAFSDASFEASEIVLSSTWQRASLTVTLPAGANALRLLLDNRSSQGLTDASAGVVEVFGGMIVELGIDATYQTRP